MASRVINGEPYELEFDPGTTALLIIDMQRDFVEPGGFGESLGNDISILRKTIAPIRQVLEDCVGSYFPEFQRARLAMIKAQGGIFGWVSDSGHALQALARH